MNQAAGHTDTTDAAPNDRLGTGLRERHVAMIAIGGIIGAGLFVGSSTAIATVGPAVIVSYALAGLVILMVMRMLSEMATALPGTGSFTEFTRTGIGDWAAFLTGWLYWYFWVVVVAIEAIAGAKILALWLPFASWQIGLVLLALMTATNLMSARAYGEFEFWFASIKVAAILVFIVIAGAYVFGLTGQPGTGFGNITAYGGFAPNGVGAILAGVTSVIFALCGAEIATIAAAESPDPERTVTRLTGSVAVRILLFYLISMTLIVAAMPWTEIVPGNSPFAAVLDRVGLPAAGTIMNAVVLVAVLSCLNSAVYVTSRQLFVLAGRGDAPRWMVAVNKRQVPARAILIGSLFGFGAVIVSVISEEVVFSFLINASGATMLIIYLLVSVAQVRLRTRLEREAPERLKVRMWLHPWASMASIAGIAAVLLSMALTPALASQFWSSAGLAGLFLLAFAIRRMAARKPA